MQEKNNSGKKKALAKCKSYNGVRFKKPSVTLLFKLGSKARSDNKLAL